MAATFLDAFDLSDEERAKLASFGARSPLALLSLRRASPQAFDNYLGPERSAAIT